MARRILLTGLILLSACGLSMAEPSRPLLTVENRFPEQWETEVNGYLQFSELNDTNEQFEESSRDTTALVGAVRYGLAEGLALTARLPFEWVSPEQGDSQAGIGDIGFGVQFRAWQDIFDAPYLIPYFDASLKTGDDEKGIGRGENIYTFGTALGAVTYDVLHWIFDLHYGVAADSENLFAGGLSLIWELDEKFALLAEGRVTNEDVPDSSRYPTFLQAGMSYEPNEDWAMMFYGGGGSNTREDVVITARTVYTW